MSDSQNEVITSAKSVAPFFSVDIKIKIFGVTIWEIHFPPKK